MDDKKLTPETEQESPAVPHRRALRSPDALFAEKTEERVVTALETEEPLIRETQRDETEKDAVSTEFATEQETLFSDEKARSPFAATLKKEEKKKKEEVVLSSHAAVFDWIKSFLISLAVVIFVFTLIFRGVTVDGDSMLPTLSNSEYLIISDLLYTPKAGDIVVVQAPHYKDGTEPIIKRIIATEGQTVEINFHTWEIRVDGVLLQEPYILRDGAFMNAESMLPDENGIAQVRVQENCIFIMGDNRNDSLDSRSELIGQIDERYIMGRVLIRLTPFDRFGKVE